MGQRTSGIVPASCPPMTRMPPTATESAYLAAARAVEAQITASHQVPPNRVHQRGSLTEDGTVQAERLANPDEIALYVQDQAAPVGWVTASGVIRSPAELDRLRRTACWHTDRVPVLLLVHPFDHVADLCTGCGKAFPDEAYLAPTSGW